METITSQGAEDQKHCPFFNIACQEICPGWLAAVNDCLFHVCLTDVKEVFLEAARYLDDHLGLREGTGLQTLKDLRTQIVGDGSQREKDVAGTVIGALVTTGVMDKITSMSVDQIAGMILKVEDSLTFDLSDLFRGSQEPEDSE